jgi:hypothetical protein
MKIHFALLKIQDDSLCHVPARFQHVFVDVGQKTYARHPILVDLHMSSDQRRRRHAGNEQVHDITNHLESLTVQSEFSFPVITNSVNKRQHLPPNNIGYNQNYHHNMSYYSGNNSSYLAKDKLAEQKVYESEQNQSLQVSDHPHVYQNTVQALSQSPTKPPSLLSNSIRRNSIR